MRSSALAHNTAGVARCCAVVLSLLGGLTGCATYSTSKVEAPVFYPPAPDAPRLQFLASFSSSDDVGERNWLLDFLIGRRPAKSLGKPYGVAAGRDRIYVGDTGLAAVGVLDLEKRRLTYITPRGAGRFSVPANMAVDQDGTLYVADAGKGQVLVFSPTLTFVGAIGSRPTANLPAFMGGVQPEETLPAPVLQGQRIETATPMKPTGVALAGERVYIADPLNHAVRVFDKKTRQQQSVIPSDPKDERGKLYSPTNLALDQQGRVYVSDIGGFCVQQYDADGKYLQTFGRQGDRPGECIRPKGVAVDHEGRVYVVDAAAQVVQLFDAAGHLLMYFGEPNDSEHALVLPAGIAIDYENVGRFQKYAAPGFQVEYLVVVVSQFGPRLINVFGFLKPL